VNISPSAPSITPPLKKPAALRFIRGCLLPLIAALSTNPLWAQTPPLLKGVNLSHWLTYEGRQPISQRDMNMIKAHGFDHIRIPFNPHNLGWTLDRAKDLKPLPFERLDAAIRLGIEAGLNVIIDFHPEEALKQQIEEDPTVRRNFIAAWGQIARHYATWPEQRLAFELLNEPQFWVSDNPEGWISLRADILKSIRKQDLKHLILISGFHGGGVEGLLQTPPLEDPLILYTFHYYDPQLLTHLGATWEPYSSNVNSMFSGLRYPSDQNRDENILLNDSGHTHRYLVNLAIQDYEAQNWGYDRILKDIQRVSRWATDHRVSVICNEFGIARFAVEPKTRAAWLHDVSTALESQAMGWTVWDYADVFGISALLKDQRLTADGVEIPINGKPPYRAFIEEDLSALIKPMASVNTPAQTFRPQDQ
jgi:endoglucanase